MDTVKTNVNYINTHYKQYTAAIQKQAALVATSPVDLNAVKLAKDRCQELGKDVANKVYNAAEQIHTRLVGKDQILASLYDLQVSKRSDFIAQYCAVYMPLANYVIVQTRATALLSYAQHDPSVNFTEAEDTIKAQRNHVNLQQNFLDTLISPSTQSLVRDIIASKLSDYLACEGWHEYRQGKVD